jgi:hypothetical protein
MLGMLWLYCDSNKSLEIFKELAGNNDNDLRFREILTLIENNKKSINKKTN